LNIFKKIYWYILNLFKKKEEVKPPRKIGKAVIYCKKCGGGTWTTNFDLKLCSSCYKREKNRARKWSRRRKEKRTGSRNKTMEKVFKTMVKKRDGHKCIDCGDTYHLTVHHIKHQSTHPQLKYKFDNGITLCKPCHEKRHLHTGENK